VVSIDDGDNAKDALDRVTIPQEVLDRIAPTAVPRSSIIISDEPLSKETNYRTEFVAVLNNQPQGGFITRKPTVDVMARNGGWSEDGPGFGGQFFFFQRSPAPQPGPGFQSGYPRPRGQYYYQGQGQPNYYQGQQNYYQSW
jgi:hypothetical protein